MGYIANTKFQILTPDGFKSFSGVNKLTKNEYLTIYMSNGESIECSLNHILISNGAEVFAKNLKVFDTIDTADNSNVVVNDIIYNNKSIELYDIVGVSDNKLFIVDGIISHNCDCDFVSSGHTVVDGEIIQWYEQTYVEEPIERRGIDGNYWIWRQPDYTKSYVVVADVARGDSSDYSAFHVIDIEAVEQVAEYKGKIGTKEYGNMLVSVATEWNDALLVIENANIGWAVIQEVIDRNYKNLYYSYKEFGYVDDIVHLQKGVDLKDKSQMVPGFSMTSKTRPLVISKLETYMREQVPIIHSKRLIDELYVFIWVGSRPEAQSGYNDDLIISFATALWIRDTAIKLRQQGLELTRRTLTHAHKTNTIIHKGSYTNNNPWQMKNNKGQSEDIRWLL